VFEVSLNTVRASVAIGTLCVLLLCGRALALDPSLDVTQYAHTAWTYRDGLLQGAVHAIAQTPDGYLWLATHSGVVRFDGVRAVPLPLQSGQQLPSTSVGALLAARDGSLWIGTLDGLVSWKNGQLTEYPALAHSTVRALLQGRDGTVWAGGFAGARGMVCAIRGGRTSCSSGEGTFGAAVHALYEDSEGSLWVGAATGLWRWRPGPPTRFLETPIFSRYSLTQGDKGAGLTIAADSVRQVIGRTVTVYHLPGVRLPLTAATVLRDHNGGLWIGTIAHGIVHWYAGKASTFTNKDGLSSDQVFALFEDREGTIWAATAEGLDQFRELPVASLSAKQGLSNANVNSVLAARDGSIWIGTGDGLNRWDGERMKVYRMRTNPGLPDDYIQSLFEDARGRIWVSGFHGLAEFQKGNFTPVPSVPWGFKNALAADANGGLWLSLWFTKNDYGLAHLVNGEKIVEHESWQKMGGGPGTGLVPDSDGGVWTGLLSGGLAHFRAGEIRKLPLSDDRGGPRKVLDVSRDRDGSIWAATENGLIRMKDARVATLTTANGLPCNAVHWIIEDNSSSYWLYTQCGLLRIARADMDAWIADPKRTIRPTTFDAADGVRLVPMLKGYRPAVTKSSDGKIWFLNGDAAVSSIDPSRVSRIGINSLPPPVHIERITANGKTYDARPGLRLPPHVHNLDVDYTALSFVAPEKMHFRYKLEGQDRDWREVVNDRQVQYSNLAPGTYRFRVMACNNSGVWNLEGDTIEFSITPAYYQTNWFRALCAAILLALLWAAYQFRMWQLQRQFDLALEARVGERTRIARELHDTLLQSFQGVLAIFQAGIYELPAGAVKARRRLEEAVDLASEAITAGRDAVQGLRTSRVEENDLATALRTIREEIASADTKQEPPTFRVIVEGASRTLHPLLREDVSRLAAEALRNAFRHASARCVEVELRYDEKYFRLRVRDDGKGISPEVLRDGREGHYGLPGMRERAKLSHGRLTISSEVDHGTVIELVIPASKAYAKSIPSSPEFVKRSETDIYAKDMAKHE